MTNAVLTSLRLASFALAVQQVALAQQCYYPNGAPAPDSEKPCSSAEGAACCPEKWQCLDNGLCYYDASKIYGRYSCTDKSWKSEGCPSNMCTYDMKASGAEAITQCSNHNNQWCCDANRVDVDCCQGKPEPRPFFVLQDGKAYGVAGSSTGSDAPNLAGITGSALGKGGDDSPSSTPTPSNSPSKTGGSASATKDGSASSAPSSTSTSLQISVSSGSSGTFTVTSTLVTPVPAPSSASGTNPSDTSEKKSKVPIIVGCAVGVPLGIAFIGILAWLLRKQRQQHKQNRYNETPDPYTNGNASPEFAGGAKLHKGGAARYNHQAEPGVPELAGQSVGPGRPVSTIKGRAELESGAAFAPGTAPMAPHLVGVGGGNGTGNTPQSSWGSAPPGYSPGQNQNRWAPGHAQQPSVGSMQDGGVPVGGAAAAPAAPQTGGGRYIPYRPPPGHDAALPAAAGGFNMSHMPEMAEMNAVQTPPEAAEMSAVRTPPAEMGSGRTPPAR